MTERNHKGQFVQGNKASPGRPKHATEIEYLNILKQGVSVDDFRKIVNTAVSLAMAGDRYAREWLANYLIGKPVQTLELRAADAAVLGQVIKQLEARGISAGDVFESMLQELQAADMQLESRIEE